MKVSHERTVLTRAEKVFDRLDAFLAYRRETVEPVEDMEAFERQVHEYFVAAEREVLAKELALWREQREGKSPVRKIPAYFAR